MYIACTMLSTYVLTYRFVQCWYIEHILQATAYDTSTSECSLATRNVYFVSAAQAHRAVVVCLHN